MRFERRLGRAAAFVVGTSIAAGHASEAQAIVPANYEHRMEMEEKGDRLKEYVEGIVLPGGGALQLEIPDKGANRLAKISLYANGKMIEVLNSEASGGTREGFQAMVYQALDRAGVEYARSSAGQESSPAMTSHAVQTEAAPANPLELARSTSYMDEAVTRRIMRTYGVEITPTQIRLAQDRDAGDRLLGNHGTTGAELIVGHDGPDTVVITLIPDDGTPEVLRIERGQIDLP